MLDFQELLDENPDEPVEVSTSDLLDSDLSSLPDELTLLVFESDYPETQIWREGANLVAEISEHIYTKYWWHKYHASFFAEAMKRAVLRLAAEGDPIGAPVLDCEDDVHIFVRWHLVLSARTDGRVLIDSVRTSFDRVWARANTLLEHSDSVLVLGKDTEDGLVRLKTIERVLESLGYYVYIIREQPDRFGEGVIQKVLRFALSSKFVMVENSEPSGHLYEIPHVTKMAECVTACLQEEGRGATWMFEDAYAKYHHFQKFTYPPANLESAVSEAVKWAESFVSKFGQIQQGVLPWLKANEDSR